MLIGAIRKHAFILCLSVNILLAASIMPRLMLRSTNSFNSSDLCLFNSSMRVVMANLTEPGRDIVEHLIAKLEPQMAISSQQLVNMMLSIHEWTVGELLAAERAPVLNYLGTMLGYSLPRDGVGLDELCRFQSNLLQAMSFFYAPDSFFNMSNLLEKICMELLVNFQESFVEMLVANTTWVEILSEEDEQLVRSFYALLNYKVKNVTKHTIHSMHNLK
jgi:hypothetical protein